MKQYQTPSLIQASPQNTQNLSNSHSQTTQVWSEVKKLKTELVGTLQEYRKLQTKIQDIDIKFLKELSWILNIPKELSLSKQLQEIQAKYLFGKSQLGKLEEGLERAVLNEGKLLVEVCREENLRGRIRLILLGG